jgi:hypothetical protein
MEKTTAGSDDPIITTLDRNCAIFVRDVLFPLRRDWGSGRNHRQHSTIHPALYALDRLRTDLIDKRNTTMSYSGIFPRGVLLVPNKTSSATSNGSTIDNNNNGSMEWNGQPNIVESTVEVIPNVLSVKCVRCDAYNNTMKYTPSSANSKAFMRQITKPESTGGVQNASQPHHELVVCSDRILQDDYYRQFGGRGKDESLLKEQQQQRREDMPIQSTRAIEETLIREITKLKVNTDDENNTASTTNDVLTYSSLSSNTSSASSSSSSICDEYAKFELMAAKVSECMLLRKQKETRIGSALKPSSPFLFSMLPIGTQHNFVNRCIQSVAIKYTTDAVKQQKSKLNDVYTNAVPKECVERAWKNHQ